MAEKRKKAVRIYTLKGNLGIVQNAMKAKDTPEAKYMQKDLAKATGIIFYTLSTIVRAVQVPTEEQQKKICEALDIPPDQMKKFVSAIKRSLGKKKNGKKGRRTRKPYAKRTPKNSVVLVAGALNLAEQVRDEKITEKGFARFKNYVSDINTVEMTDDASIKLLALLSEAN